MDTSILQELKSNNKILINFYATEIIKNLRTKQQEAIDSELVCLQNFSNTKDKVKLKECFKNSSNPKWYSAATTLKKTKIFFEESKGRYDSIMIDCKKNYSDSDINVCIKKGLKDLKVYYKEAYLKLSTPNKN